VMRLLSRGPLLFLLGALIGYVIGQSWHIAIDAGRWRLSNFLMTSFALLTAIGTIGAVVAAVWLQGLRANRLRPSLSLQFNFKTHDVVMNLDPPRLYVRFTVINGAGRHTAARVECWVIGVQEHDTVPTSSRNVRWKTKVFPSLRRLKWAGLPQETLERLPPSLPRRVDVMEVRTPVSADDQLVLWVPYLSEQHGRALPPGTYRLILALVAHNIDTTYWETTISLKPQTAKAASADYREYLDVTEPTRVGSKIGEAIWSDPILGSSVEDIGASSP
jgi:hypothetical protein